MLQSVDNVDLHKVHSFRKTVFKLGQINRVVLEVRLQSKKDKHYTVHGLYYIWQISAFVSQTLYFTGTHRYTETGTLKICTLESICKNLILGHDAQTQSKYKI